jgi:hypothetical protein
MTCPRHNANDTGPLRCTREEGHPPGCQFVASAWSAAGEDAGHRKGGEE